MAWPTVMAVVEVEWQDSAYLDRWLTPAELDAGLTAGARCKTAGYLYRDTPEEIVIVGNQNDGSGELCGAIQIPRALVRGLVVLREAVDAPEQESQDTA